MNNIFLFLLQLRRLMTKTRLLRGHLPYQPPPAKKGDFLRKNVRHVTPNLSKGLYEIFIKKERKNFFPTCTEGGGEVRYVP